MILTVEGRLWVYCSNLPQGFSTFTEGGLFSKKYVSSLMLGQFKLSVPFLGDIVSSRTLPRDECGERLGRGLLVGAFGRDFYGISLYSA